MKTKHRGIDSSRKIISRLGIVLIFLTFLNTCNRPDLPKPTEVQYKWHEQERIMFIHFGPATWAGVEQNDHSVPLERINPSKLNTDQWCEAAMAWGAEQIIFVAKHTGGFCWWQTQTTDYGIRNTPYKNGEGDVLQELSESCNEYGLKLGVYIYPGDRTWGAGIGSGGRTKDPSKQEAYNEVFRKQLTEVLTNYGEMTEVWFDGSLVIDVSDILEKHAQNAVIFQGPQATIRWPGTESGKLFYPAWNTVKSEDLKTGVSTQIHGTPNGDAWAPLEADTPLYDHYWFWSPEKAKKRKSVDQLMDIYYKSVGYGGVLLLNATPDTTGLIPEKDMERYREFGREIKRRFGNPLAEVKSKKGNEVTLTFDKPTLVNHAIIMEDYRKGERIRRYRLEGLSDGKWVELTSGISVGRKKIDYFDQIEIEAMRLIVTESAATPLIRSLSAYFVSNFDPPEKENMHVYARPRVVSEWQREDLEDNKLRLKIDLSDQIHVPGQYTLSVKPESQEGVEIRNAEMYYNGNQAMEELVTIDGLKVHLNQTAQMTTESKLFVVLDIYAPGDGGGKVEFKPELVYSE
ncbi:MAG: alpha-L-fucosidase [Bacteroidales bacterium]|nr:alpha-L-fucosidase [Bacteroidales bacterium]MBS3775389.1 alpha-L-fucosidase [Bacteroidales bacterium]